MPLVSTLSYLKKKKKGMLHFSFLVTVPVKRAVDKMSPLYEFESSKHSR